MENQKFRRFLCGTSAILHVAADACVVWLRLNLQMTTSEARSNSGRWACVVPRRQ